MKSPVGHLMALLQLSKGLLCTMIQQEILDHKF